MNYSTAVILINDKIRVVRGMYEDNGSSDVFKTLDQDLKKNDIVVVESHTRWGYTTVKINEVDNVTVDFDSAKEVKWVVQKIAVEAHAIIKDMEAKAIEVIKVGELRKRRQDIRQNTLDAMTAGEIDKLDIAKLTGVPQLEAKVETK